MAKDIYIERESDRIDSDYGFEWGEGERGRERERESQSRNA